jgi:hypothetical protein
MAVIAILWLLFVGFGVVAALALRVAWKWATSKDRSPAMPCNHGFPDPASVNFRWTCPLGRTHHYDQSGLGQGWQ